MDEHEFDALFQQPYGKEETARTQARSRRSSALAVALWGRTFDDLWQKLLAPRPEIPPGFDLVDFQELERMVQRILVGVSDPRHAWILAHRPLWTVVVGTRRYSEWEARCEIVRRAVEYLENR
jgi:hypothetical protein